MLKKMMIRTAKVAVLASLIVSTVVMSGCKWPKPEMDYMGYYGDGGNCLKYGNECAVLKINTVGGYTVHEYVVDLR